MRKSLIAIAGLALSACGNSQQAAAPEVSAPSKIEVTAPAPTALQAETFGALTGFVGKSFEGVPTDSSTEDLADIQTWDWALGGTAILIRHVLANGEYGGDTYVYKDAKTGELVYVYITSAGFRTEGVMVVNADGSYTAEEAVEGHPTITRVRSTSHLNDDGTSSMTSEYLDDGEWTAGHAFTYRPTDKPLPALKVPGPEIGVARFFDPSMLARTYRDPVAQASLVVDLIPVYAVLVLGWGAAPLVFLYWLENLVIGGVTIARMLGAGAMQGLGFLAGAVFLSLFFCVHYGMFCFGHGQFLSMMANGGDALTQSEPVMFTPQGLIEFALASGPQMGVFLAIILGWQAFLYVYDFLIGGEAKTANMGKEMVAPYGRIILLHIALFAGMFGAIALGDPMAGVLGLILLRTVWGVFLSVRRRMRLDIATLATR